jgi:hypothetical protein
VDIVLNVICFSILAPDLLTRVAFVSIGVMIVLFVFRSWSKRQYISWLIFVSVVFFFDYSFTLETTRLQSATATVSEDAVLMRLQSNIDRSYKTLDSLHAQYAAAMKRETLDEINAQIITENARMTQYEADARERQVLIDDGKTHKIEITAANIFNAVPNAWKDKRYIDLVIWGLIFIGLQAIVASSIDNRVITAPVEPPRITETPKQTRKKPARKKTTPDITRQEVDRWVKWSWYRISRHESDKIISRQSFFELAEKQGLEFDGDKYAYLMRRAKETGVIDKEGHALIVDETAASKKIIGNRINSL